jgi:transposase
MILGRGRSLSLRLVLDELWVLAQPLILQFTLRRQGGGTGLVDDRAVFTAIVYVLTSGCVWRDLPPTFRVTVPTTAAAIWAVNCGDVRLGPVSTWGSRLLIMCL